MWNVKKNLDEVCLRGLEDHVTVKMVGKCSRKQIWRQIVRETKINLGW